MRKFANIHRIEERVTAQKLGLTIDQLRAKVAADLKAQREIDAAWAAARKEEKTSARLAREAVRIKEDEKKQKQKKPKAPKKPASGVKQKWDGIKWVKLETTDGTNA